MSGGNGRGEADPASTHGKHRMKDRVIQIVRDSAWYMGVNLVSAAIGFIAIPIFTRIFNPSDYGIYSLVNTAITLGAPIFYVYLHSSVMRFYPEYEKKGETDLFYSTAFHYVPYFMIMFLGLLLPLAIFVLPLGQYRLVICLGIAVFALYSLYNVMLAFLRIRQMTWQYASLYVFVQFTNYLVGAGIAVWLNAGIAGPFWGWLVALAVAVLLQMWALGVWGRVRSGRNSPALQKEFFRFGFALIFTTFLTDILTASDRYMVMAMKGAFQVGLYTVVYTLIMSVERIMVSFMVLAAVPVIYRLYEEEGEESAIELVKRVTRYFLIILAPVVVGLCVLRDPILHVITSPKYYAASSIMTPLAIGIFLSNLAWLPLMAFRLKKKSNMSLFPMAIAAASNVVLNLVLISRYGYTGAAWATLISYFLYFVLLTAIGQGYMKWSFPWAGAARVLAASAVMGVALFGLERTRIEGLAGLLALVASGAVIYFAVLVLVGGITRSELAFAAGILARIPLVGIPFSRWKRGSGK